MPQALYSRGILVRTPRSPPSSASRTSPVSSRRSPRTRGALAASSSVVAMVFVVPDAPLGVFWTSLPSASRVKRWDGPMSASVLFDAPGPKAPPVTRDPHRHRRAPALARALVVISKMRQARQLRASPLGAVRHGQSRSGSTTCTQSACGTRSRPPCSRSSSPVFFGLLLLGSALGEQVDSLAGWCHRQFFRAVPVLIMMILFFGHFAKAETLPADWRPFFAAVVIAP